MALFLVSMIGNDDVWNMVIRDLKFGKDLTEQQDITRNNQLLRKIFGWILIIPGVGLVMLFVAIKNIMRF
jgi:hypothetical protein